MDKYIQRRDASMKTEAETAVKQPPGKHTEESRWGQSRESRGRKRGHAHSHQELEEAEDGLSPEAEQACWQSPFELHVSRTAREYISIVLRHTVGGDLLQQPWEANTTSIQQRSSVLFFNF